MKVVERTFNEGDCACEEQANISVGFFNFATSANEWSCIQNNNNNEWYLSLADGSYNNNNKNYLYWVVPVESKEVCDIVFIAEEECWSNKHSSWDAVKYHYHAGRRIWQFIKDLGARTYRPWKSYCFVIMFPKPREIFAAHYQDRIAHHIIAPYLTAVSEAVHNKNGNVSFGNRKKMSSYHACLRVQKLMREHPDGYVASFDLKGYFMSIERRMAWRVFCEYEAQFRPQEYTEQQRDFIMWLAELLITSDPSINCERRSPMRLWTEHIKPHKSLFGNGGNGLPIGNYYAQIIANLLPEKICEALAGYNITEFVDDFVVVVDNAKQVREAQNIIDRVIGEIGLERNKKKVYVQPVKRGILWCGHYIFPNRMYTSSRTIRNCERKVNAALMRPTLRRARRLQQTLNSYFGMMMHDAEFKTQRRIADKVAQSPYGEWIRFDEEKSHLICRLKDEFKKTSVSAKEMQDIERYIKTVRYDSNSSKERLKALRAQV